MTESRPIHPAVLSGPFSSKIRALFLAITCILLYLMMVQLEVCSANGKIFSTDRKRACQQS